MKAIERLYQYLENKGIKPTNFERELGLSNGYLSSQKKRNADIGESIIVKITDNCRDLSLVWFLTGRGSMLHSDRDYQVQSAVSVEDQNKNDLITLQRDRIKTLEAEISDLKKGLQGGSVLLDSYTPVVEIAQKITHN